jgi:hypothetical protein
MKIHFDMRTVVGEDIFPVRAELSGEHLYTNKDTALEVTHSGFKT